LPRI